ncbi:kinase-like domain-containing protein [Clohesyomyces aquaticus]|uniref:Kinase-like domain-containing protein n=1 Tax=Clohesyomyces aquaticus TaxID=1231657 RepID=A0A1Y2A5T0_9PLEO|nr:kinase-like domain-containing protein [Clohesyomyces aquaticus]
MSASSSPNDVASALLAEKGLQLQSLKVLQSLWAGYGFICQVTASPIGLAQSYILKLITPPPAKANDEGHIRKILSYQVEQYFYSHLAPHMPPSIPVAQCLASINHHHPNGTSTTAMLLADLKQQYPIAGEKREALSPTQVHTSLDWLASFHGFWWPRMKNMDRKALVRPPLEEVKMQRKNQDEMTVWLNGGYTYLATRRSEFNLLVKDNDAEWNESLTEWEEGDISLSEMVAAVLAPKPQGWGPTDDYQTLIHGDVKSENLFTSVAGDKVAFYDFQYVGLGLGVCDLAKLFTCSVPLSMLYSGDHVPRELPMQQGEKDLLERYLDLLKKTGQKSYDWEIFVRHWETALVDWLRFQASWGFWGNTEWLEARVRSILRDVEWKSGILGNRTYAETWSTVN